MRIKNLFVGFLIFVCFSSIMYGQKTVVRSVLTIEEAEKLADRLARDFEIRSYFREKIIYEDYNPITNEQRYCEDSKISMNILQRSSNPNGVVCALIEYDKNGYFIVFGQYILNNPSKMIEAVVHEVSHGFCVARGLKQGKDEHSEDYIAVYDKLYDYTLSKLDGLLR